MDKEDNKIIKAITSKNGITDARIITRYTSGINNKVYSVGDKYIVKLEGDFEFLKGILKFQHELNNKLIIAGVKVPKIIDHGTMEGKGYLLMEKLRGSNLVYDWLKFTMAEKENYIVQLAEQLKIVHSIKFENYIMPIAEYKIFSNLKDAIKRTIDFKRIDKSKLKHRDVADVESLERFYENHIELLNEQGTAVLVHNDLNLENILYEAEKITGIIDWDWACQAPKDYELWKIIEVFHEPKYSVEGRLEPLYENYKMIEEFRFIRKAYPELFKSNKIADRVRLYYLAKIIDTIADYQKGRWSEKAMFKIREEINDFYRNGWLDKLILN